MEHFFNKKILLASQSPRRRQLLSESGFQVEFVNIEVEEDFHSDLKAAEIPEYLAEKKSRAYLESISEDTVLVTADTIVWLNDHVMNKPLDLKDAASMLKSLSGKKHTVYTGVCIRNNSKLKVFSVATDVYFAPLSDEMIAYYLNHYRPLDKAGAYGIQEFIGYAGIERIEGCYYNVMGFPVSRFIKELDNFTN